MKVLQNIALSAAAILVIAGCGSGGGGETTAAAADVSLSGAAVDGYLNGATVCLDINGDGLCTIATEPTTNTDATGDYSLTVTAAEAASNAPLLVYGGIDADTGEWFGGRLKAPVESSGTINITPLTTMVESVVRNGASIADAEQEVADALGIADVALVAADPVALYNTNPEVLEAALTVQKIVEVMASAAVTSGAATQTDDAIEDIYAELATAIATVAADSTSSGMTAIVTEASTSATSLIDDTVVAAAQTIEDRVSDIFADTTTDIGDSSLLIDAAAEDVEDAVVVAVDTNAVIDETTVITITPVTVEFIAIANIFDAYDVTISDAAIDAIAAALSTSTVTVANITGLSITTNGADTAIAALIAAISAHELEAELQAVEIYLAGLDITSLSDALMAKINALTGYNDTLTKTEFAALLRGTTDVDLNAIADQIDPPAVVGTPFTWEDLTEFNAHWVEDYNDIPVLGKTTVTLNNGTLSFSDEFLDPATGLWVASLPDMDDDYQLNDAGEWELWSISTSYTTSADGSTLTLADGEQVQLAAAPVTDLSGLTQTIDEKLGLDVAYSTGAEKYNLLFKDIERYELDWVPTVWNATGNTGDYYTTLDEFIASGSCVYWKEVNDTNGECVQFSQNTQPTDNSGDLVTIDWSTGLETTVGTWEYGHLPGQPNIDTILTTISDPSFLEDHEDYKFLTLFQQKVWVGSHHPADTTFEPEDHDDIFVNSKASTDITNAMLALP